MLFREKPNECLQWRPHHKNSKTFPPWLQAPIKILSEKNRAKRRPDFCFSNEKRGSVHYWKIITNLLGVKNQKRHLKRGKNGDFEGVFSLYLLLRHNVDFKNRAQALHCLALSTIWQTIKKPVKFEVRPTNLTELFHVSILPWFRPWNQFFNRNFTSRNFLGSTSFWCWIRQNSLWLCPRFSKICGTD